MAGTVDKPELDDPFALLGRRGGKSLLAATPIDLKKLYGKIVLSQEAIEDSQQAQSAFDKAKEAELIELIKKMQEPIWKTAPTQEAMTCDEGLSLLSQRFSL